MSEYCRCYIKYKIIKVLCYLPAALVVLPVINIAVTMSTHPMFTHYLSGAIMLCTPIGFILIIIGEFLNKRYGRPHWKKKHITWRYELDGPIHDDCKAHDSQVYCKECHRFVRKEDLHV